MTTKLKFSEFLTQQRLSEAPINDYETVGDFNKGYSIRSKRDRAVITHPAAIARTKKKFGATDFVFNFYFVNKKEVAHHSEVGVVTPEWVREELGDDVYQAISKNFDKDEITVIYTNNNAGEKVAPTAWILAHRIGHALDASDRRGPKNNNAGHYYKQAHDHLVRAFSNIADYYGMRNVSSDSTQIRGRSRYDAGGDMKARRDQLAMTNFFQQVCTFKSARDKNIRDWFEVMNELIAQFLTTGKIKFNKAPQMIPGKNRYYLQNAEEANDDLEMLARDLNMLIDDLFSSVIGSIFVM